MSGTITPAANAAGQAASPFNLGSIANASGDTGAALLGMGAMMEQSTAFQMGLTALNDKKTRDTSALHYINETIANNGQAVQHTAKLGNQVAA